MRHRADQGSSEPLAELFKKAIAPAVAVFLLYHGVVDLSPALRAMNGEGRPGVLVIREACVWEDDCTPYGDFFSDDGRHVVVGANWNGPTPADLKVGDRLPALDTGDSSGVFHPEGSTGAVMWPVLLLVVGTGVLLVWAYLVLIQPRLKRRRA